MSYLVIEYDKNRNEIHRHNVEPCKQSTDWIADAFKFNPHPDGYLAALFKIKGNYYYQYETRYI